MNRSKFSVPLVNGTFDQELPGAIPGYYQIVLSFVTRPSAGRLALFTRVGVDDDWIPVEDAQNIDLTSNRVAVAFGAIQALRFVLSGVVGGATLTAWVSASGAWPGVGFPEGSFTGLRALTVQNYAEANVKRGLQYNLRAAWPLGDEIPAAGVRKIWFKTTAKSVLVKLRELQFVAEELKLQLFRAPTGVTAGTDLSIHNYNGVSPVTTTVLAKKNVTTVTNGTEFDAGDPEYVMGSAVAPQRGVSTALQGRERVLPANTEFLVVITNTGTSPARVQYFLDWYEGASDLPVN